MSGKSTLGSYVSHHFETKVGKRPRAITITDKSIYSKSGKSLDETIDNFPRPCLANIQCGIHRWLGQETERNVSFFPSCNVDLYNICYSGFHHCTDLLKEKID